MTTAYDTGYFQNMRREMLPFLPQRVERMLVDLSGAVHDEAPGLITCGPCPP